MIKDCKVLEGRHFSERMNFSVPTPSPKTKHTVEFSPKNQSTISDEQD